MIFCGEADVLNVPSLMIKISCTLKRPAFNENTRHFCPRRTYISVLDLCWSGCCEPAGNSTFKDLSASRFRKGIVIFNL